MTIISRSIRCGSSSSSFGLRVAPASTPASASILIASCLVCLRVHSEIIELISSACSARESKSAKRELPPIPDAEWVETRKVHMAPKPGSDAVGEPIPADPAVQRRRAEVLGDATPAKKFTLKDGEVLMSPSDRLRELGNLADEMELLYFSSLGN